MSGNPGDPIAYAIAEKQLYSSHYFETALDLAFCVRDTTDPKQLGFYLIMVMGFRAGVANWRKGFHRPKSCSRPFGIEPSKRAHHH